MKLITPQSMSKSHAKPVSSWDEIKDDAWKMLALLKNGKFGSKIHDGHAIHHAQVSENPFNFFVTNPKHTSAMFNENIFIINPKITQKADAITDFHEQCLSFPLRKSKKTKRYMMIKVTYDTLNQSGDGISQGHEQELNRLSAIIFQHEMDHAQGTNIYDKFKKATKKQKTNRKRK